MPSTSPSSQPRRSDAPRRRRPRGPILVVAAGIALAALVLAVASRLDRGAGEGSKPRRIAAPTDVVGPTPLSDEDIRSGRGFGHQSSVELERGAWVQVVDERGRLSQQYKAAKVEPLPERWMAFEQPRAIFFQPDGRVIALEADAGRARAPSRALETGTLSGNVVIRVYRPLEGRAADPEVDPPALDVATDEASFDNILGEIRCEGPVTVRSAAGLFKGTGLSLLVDPERGTLERLVVDRALEPILLSPAAADGRASPQRGAATQGSAAPSPDAAAPPTAVDAAPAAERDAPRFYRLTLEDDVLVTRRRGDAVVTLAGDRLVAVFAIDAASSIDPLAGLSNTADAAVLSCGAHNAIVLAALGLPGDAAPDPPAETITIAYAGRLVLEPAMPEEALDSRDDVLLSILALDGRHVTIRDDPTESVVICSKASFRQADELIEAFGWTDRPLTLESPRLDARGERFLLRRLAGAGGFVGPGSVRLASGGESFAMLASSDDATVVESGQGTIRAVRAAPAPQDGSAVTIAWEERLDLTFVPREEARADRIADGALRSATFVGGVQARGDGFDVDADEIRATFATADGRGRPAAGGRRETALERLEASGDAAIARRADGSGSLAAQSIRLDLATAEDGRVRPVRLGASGTVAAIDPGQAIFGEELVVDFLPETALDAAPTAGTQGLEIASAEAGGSLELVLRDDAGPWTRVYADRLDGDGRARTLAIEGDDVRIVRDAVLASALRRVELDEAARTARSPGGGEVRVFARSLAAADEALPGAAPARRAFAMPVEPPTLLATWRGDFRFREGTPEASAGESEIELREGVRVRSTPDRASTDALDAEELLIVLAPDASADARTESSRDPIPGTSGARTRVRSLRARGEAVAESRQWPDAARTGDPRLFRLSGGDLAYDLSTREGRVAGGGTMLIHVPAGTSDAPERSSDEPVADIVTAEQEVFFGPRSGLGAEGTSRFRWSRGLDLVAAGGDRFRIDLDGAVELVHAGAGSDDAMALTCGRLTASVVRPDRGDADEPEAGADLGGTARLLGIDAFSDDSQRVVILSGGTTFECDHFVYSVETRRATLAATDRRRVRVLSRDRPQPVLADRVEWDMASGRIVIENAAGRVGR